MGEQNNRYLHWGRGGRVYIKFCEEQDSPLDTNLKMKKVT